MVFLLVLVLDCSLVILLLFPNFELFAAFLLDVVVVFCLVLYRVLRLAVISCVDSSLVFGAVFLLLPLFVALLL